MFWPRLACLLALTLPPASLRADAPSCREDDRLAETAASLLLDAQPIAAADLLTRARANGFDGVALHARESASDAAIQSWLAGLLTTREGELWCGEARNESRRLVLASVRGGRLFSEGKRLHGELAAGFSRPSLVVESAEGALHALAIDTEQLARGFTVPSALAARRVQLVAESASGPHPVAELALSALPAVDQGPLRSASPPDEVARQPLGQNALIEQLQALRQAGKVGRLRENRLLADSARRHAARVCALGKLAHRVDGDDPEARLAREHVSARGVGEVIARSSSSAGAYRALLASPSHRLTIMRSEFTDVGLGQAIDPKGQVCLVVVLASWPRRTP